MSKLAEQAERYDGQISISDFMVVFIHQRFT
jgi:hypothetical protein